ncbi:recombinase family protein [Sodalinema gerasimenkoae]|uniref:recombinase family protein n=1 Tax=Sodalinema gerasimenkoae TaxID=2862348 RepID=UPI001356F7E2|nr:recombinase family protein [Sodalinema gerasimenkoae]
MSSQSIWLLGSSRSGKTSYLVAEVARWLDELTGEMSEALLKPRLFPGSILVFAATGDNRLRLSEQLLRATGGRGALTVTTPLGFFQQEVSLFWTLIAQKLGLQVAIPLRLQPETEQMLAQRLWAPHLEEGILEPLGASRKRQVRRGLDVLQLAGAAGVAPEEIGQRLQEGLGEELLQPEAAQLLQVMLLQWRDWCLGRGLLTYGVVLELYWRYLLPNSEYQVQLRRRFLGVAADDVDDYPAISRDLFETLLRLQRPGLFSFNPQGKIRLGLNADPDTLEGLCGCCEQVIELERPSPGLVGSLAEPMIELALNPTYLMQLPASVPSLQTVARSQLLRRVGDEVARIVRDGSVSPAEIAIIAPGLDAIARYSLGHILQGYGIPVRPLQVQRPLFSNPRIRAVLTLLPFFYGGLGRRINRDLVAEMLVMLSQNPQRGEQEPPSPEKEVKLGFEIDPVRGGTLADACYRPDPEWPELLPAASFPGGDRLGYRATRAYEQMRQWLDETRSQVTSGAIASPVVLLDRIIGQFCWYRDLADDQREALRELLETASHFWEVESRVGGDCGSPTLRDRPLGEVVGDFLTLLQSGTVTANPYPLKPRQPEAVTLSTVYQYRSNRLAHRYHFWLDISSPLWLQGGASVLFAAPIFERSRPLPYDAQARQQDDEARLQRILQDLLSRVEEQVILCHSDLAVNGQEQTGPLLALANASVSINELNLT